MIRRLIRWLARNEIADAKAEVAARMLNGAIEESMQKFERQAHYLKGFTEGSDRAFDAVETAVRERMGGSTDLVMPEDIRRAKRGLVH